MLGNTMRLDGMRIRLSRPARVLALPLLITALALPARGGELEALLGALAANDVRDRVDVSFDDFLSRARAGLDRLLPGRTASSPTCLVVAEWSPAVAREVEAYLVRSYAHMVDASDRTGRGASGRRSRRRGRASLSSRGISSTGGPARRR